MIIKQNLNKKFIEVSYFNYLLQSFKIHNLENPYRKISLDQYLKRIKINCKALEKAFKETK